MIRNNIERRVLLLARVKLAHNLVDGLPSSLINLEVGYWVFEVSCVGQAVGTKRAEFWQFVVTIKDFLNVASCQGC